MKFKYLVLALVLCVFSCATDEEPIENLVPVQVFVGDVKLHTQTAVDSFAAFRYGGITGLFELSDQFEPIDPIINLEGLNSLTSIGGDLILDELAELVSISGFENLKSLSGNLLITYNPNLSSLEPLRNVSASVYSLWIKGTGIQSLDGLQNIKIKEGGNIFIWANQFLTDAMALSNSIPPTLRRVDFRGESFRCNPDCTSTNYRVPLSDFSFMSNLKVVERQFIMVNQSNVDFRGFENLSEMQSLFLAKLDVLQDISQLNGITVIRDGLTIADCDILTNLDGLDSLTQLGGVRIGTQEGFEGNNSLNDFCALQDVFSNNTLDPSLVTIRGNAYNPTIQDIIHGDCSN